MSEVKCDFFQTPRTTFLPLYSSSGQAPYSAATGSEAEDNDTKDIREHAKIIHFILPASTTLLFPQNSRENWDASKYFLYSLSVGKKRARESEEEEKWEHSTHRRQHSQAINDSGEICMRHESSQHLLNLFWSLSTIASSNWSHFNHVISDCATLRNIGKWKRAALEMEVKHSTNFSQKQLNLIRLRHFIRFYFGRWCLRKSFQISSQ